MALWGDAPVRARRRCLPACWACKCSPRRPTGPYRYALDAEACKRDVHAKLRHVAERIERDHEELLGAVMFTCSGEE